MTESGIRAVAFDAVGTLIHPVPSAGDVYAAVGQRHGSRLSAAELRRRFAAAFAEQECLDRANCLETSEARERQRWQQIVAQVLDDVVDPATCFDELYAHFARPDAWQCEPDTANVLTQLQRAGCALALASNYDHRLRMVAAGLPPLAAIRTIVISSEVGWRKPAPAFFSHLARVLQLPPRDILYVGDDIANDYAPARNAGLRSVLFDPQNRCPDGAIQRIGRLADLSGFSSCSL